MTSASPCNPLTVSLCGRAPGILEHISLSDVKGPGLKKHHGAYAWIKPFIPGQSLNWRQNEVQGRGSTKILPQGSEQGGPSKENSLPEELCQSWGVFAGCVQLNF